MEKKQQKRIEGTDIAIFLIVFVIFGIALLSFFPGLLTSDNVDQIGQAKNNRYYDAHPILHSFVMGNLVKLGGAWVPALVQIIVFALMWTWGCKQIRKENPRNIIKLIEIVFTIGICSLPLNFLYSITLWKDILYSYCILASVIGVYIAIRNDYHFTIPQMILISLANVGIMRFRHNGVPIGIFMFVLLLVIGFFKNKNIKKSIIFIGIFVITLGVATLPKWLFKIKGAETVAAPFQSSEVYCFGALLKSGITLEPEEEEFINQILDIEEWKDSYDPYTGLPILYHSGYHEKLLKEEEMNKKFEEIFMKYAKQNMGVVIKHMADVNSIWWSIPEQGNMHSVIINNGSIREISDGAYETRSLLGKMGEELSNYTIRTLGEGKEFVYNLIYRPAVPFYLAIILILAVAIKEKKFSYLFMVFPMGMNIGTYILFITSQDQRYFYPNFLTAYFVILVFVAAFMKLKENPEKKLKKKKKVEKTLVIIPDYNEGETIKKVVEDIQENAPKCDYLIVNDGSKDDTKEICKKNHLNCISLPTNYGLASAVQLGMKYALDNGYDVAIQFDGDGQHKAQYLKEMIHEIEEGADIVIGSRFVTEKKPVSMRMLGNNLISFCINLLADKEIKDSTSGMRAFNRVCMEELVIHMNLPPEPDTLMYMIRNGMEVKEVQVKMEERQAGESYLTAWKSIKYMLNVMVSIVFINFLKKGKKKK